MLSHVIFWFASSILNIRKLEVQKGCKKNNTFSSCAAKFSTRIWMISGLARVSHEDQIVDQNMKLDCLEAQGPKFKDRTGYGDPVS